MSCLTTISSRQTGWLMAPRAWHMTATTVICIRLPLLCWAGGLAHALGTVASFFAQRNDPSLGVEAGAVWGRASEGDGTILMWVRNPPTPLNSILESGLFCRLRVA